MALLQGSADSRSGGRASASSPDWLYGAGTDGESRANAAAGGSSQAMTHSDSGANQGGAQTTTDTASVVDGWVRMREIWGVAAQQRRLAAR